LTDLWVSDEIHLHVSMIFQKGSCKKLDAKKMPFSTQMRNV